MKHSDDLIVWAELYTALHNDVERSVEVKPASLYTMKSRGPIEVTPAPLYTMKSRGRLK